MSTTSPILTDAGFALDPEAFPGGYKVGTITASPTALRELFGAAPEEGDGEKIDALWTFRGPQGGVAVWRRIGAFNRWTVGGYADSAAPFVAALRAAGVDAAMVE